MSKRQLSSAVSWPFDEHRVLASAKSGSEITDRKKSALVGVIGDAMIVPKDKCTLPRRILCEVMHIADIGSQ